MAVGLAELSFEWGYNPIDRSMHSNFETSNRIAVWWLSLITILLNIQIFSENNKASFSFSSSSDKLL